MGWRREHHAPIESIVEVPTTGPDERDVVDAVLRTLPARRLLTRAEAVGALTAVTAVSTDEPSRDELFRIVFAALDSVAGDALVDRSVVADALLDVRLARAHPAGGDGPEGADEFFAGLPASAARTAPGR